jgi:tripartite-type tricarboxylate transporter receptor subunit TctC
MPLIALVAATAPVHAQPYPQKAVSVLVGFPAGTAPDTLMRTVAERMSDLLGQPMMVENRPGAAGTIAASQVMAAAPDGYTLMLGVAGSLSVAPHVLPSVKYDPIRDFSPVGLIQRGPYFIAVNSDLPVHTFAELVAYAKARPGTLNYATPGVGTAHHVLFEKLQRLTGTDMVHVPLATGQAINETIAGRTQVLIDAASPSLTALVRAGRLRVVGMTGAAPLPIFPEARPVSEQGAPGLVAPLGTPPTVVARLHEEVDRVLGMPEVMERLAAHGGMPGARDVVRTPAAFGRFVAEQYVRWGALVREAGIKP